MQYLGDVDQTLSRVADKWERMAEIMGDQTDLSRKLKSELISNILETTFCEELGIRCRRGNGDHEADIYVDDNPVEIKTSWHSRSWRGGAFSKRDGDYLMVTWKENKVTKRLEFFAIQVPLLESDWKAGNVGNYYATNIDLDTLLSKNHVIHVGTVEKKRKNHHPVFL